MFNDDLYSISDIAKITKLTDRTIRNYLAKGNLKGKKIGGQWRFTKSDIYALFNNDKFEDDMKQKTLQSIVSYFESTSYKNQNNTACCVFTISFKNKDNKILFYKKMKEIENKDAVINKISFVDNNNVKLVIEADVEIINKVTTIIKEVNV